MCLLLLVATLPAWGDVSGSATSGLGDNYQLTLGESDGTGSSVEIRLVFASERFEVRADEPALVFIGTVDEHTPDGMLVHYTLTVESVIRTGVHASAAGGGGQTQTIQRVQTGTQSSARLRLGEAIEILSIGERTYSLKISEM